jgi:hypothetical protein
MTEPVQTAKETVALVADLVKAAGDNPQVKESCQNLGQAALTLTKTINNALLPLAAVNFAFEKARAYFREKFQSDLQETTKLIPEEHMTEPKASIAGPALQGITFALEEPDLKKMYLNLIATAMDRRKMSTAHPAFIEIIRQLEAQEARLLSLILKADGGLPIVRVRATTAGEDGWGEVESCVMNLMISGQPIDNPDQPAMVDNWIRLGLVEVCYDKFLTDDNAYAWVDEHPHYQRLKASVENDKVKITFLKGCIARTAFGIKFATAVGLI